MAFKRESREMLAMFKDARMYNYGRFERYKNNQAFYEGAENLLPSYNPDNIWSHNINVPYAALNTIKVVSSLQSQDFNGVLKPYNMDTADLIDKLNKVVQDIWKEADIDQEVNDAIERCAVLSEHYTHIIFEENPRERNGGRIKAYPINPASIVIDPNSRGLDDADYVFVAEALTHTKVKQLYKTQYNEIIRKSRDLNKDETGEDTYVKEAGTITGVDMDKATRLTLYDVIDGTVYKTVAVNGVIVQKTFDMEINRIPIAQLRWQTKMNSPYGISLIEKMIPSQKAVNEIESATANAALQFSSPSYLLDVNSGILPEELAAVATMPSAVIGIDGTQAPLDSVVRPLMPNTKLDDGLLLIREQLIQTMADTAGISKEFEGVLGTAGNTSSGASEALNRAKIQEERFKQQLGRYIERLARIIADIVVKDYAAIGTGVYQTLPTTNDRGDLMQSTLDLSDIDVEQYRNTPFGFYVNLDNLGGKSREISYQKLLEIKQLEAQYGGSNEDYNASVKIYDLVNMMDFERKDEIIQRMMAQETLTNEKIAESLVELVSVAIEFGIDNELLKAAIIDIITRNPEMQSFNMLMEEVDRVAEEQAMQEQAMLQEEANTLEQQYAQEEQLLQASQMAELEQTQEQMMLGDELADMEINIEGGDMGAVMEEEMGGEMGVEMSPEELEQLSNMEITF